MKSVEATVVPLFQGLQHEDAPPFPTTRTGARIGRLLCEAFKDEPEMFVAGWAFLVGLVFPRAERFCEKTIAACCDARRARTVPKENGTGAKKKGAVG